MIIYLFSFPNGKHYVGRTKNSFEQRCAEHKNRIGKAQHPLYYAFTKYGWDNVHKQILDHTSTHEELVIKELEYINKYDSLYNGYNLTLNTEIGGDNWAGRRDTQQYAEFVDKMRELTLGSKNGMYDKVHREDTKDKMKQKAKGRYSLSWFIEKYGEIEGTAKHQERNQKLKNRDYSKMKDPITGAFIKKEQK
jgi:group I intron endonuclease